MSKGILQDRMFPHQRCFILQSLSSVLKLLTKTIKCRVQRFEQNKGYSEKFSLGNFQHNCNDLIQKDLITQEDSMFKY